jgi:hypothetical protein
MVLEAHKFSVAVAQCTLAINETGEPAKCMAIGTPLHRQISYLLRLENAAGGGEVRMEHVDRFGIDQLGKVLLE